jgi:hypothetical protein
MPLKNNYPPLWLNAGNDVTLYPGTNYTINASEIISANSAILTNSSSGCTLGVQGYKWFKNGEYLASTTMPSYTITASVPPGGFPNTVIDVYTVDLITTDCSPYGFNYRLRDDIIITSDYAVSTTSPFVQVSSNAASCPNFSNVTATASIFNAYPTNPLYQWDGGAWTSASSISGLSPGNHTVSVQGVTAVPYNFTVYSKDVAPHPIISSVNPYHKCDPHLIVLAGMQSYQWFFNNVAISGATNNNYLASSSGVFKVVVTMQMVALEPLLIII